MIQGIIEVRNKSGKVLSRGTGWFVRTNLVATALHVVGKVQPRGWMHDVPGESAAEYVFLSGEHKESPLEPACFDPGTDVALLRCGEALGDTAEVPLADAFPAGEIWYADGYPGFDSGKEWTVSGQIVKRRGDRLQLVLSQGTNVSWQGVSGSALRIGHRIGGLITAETSSTNTVWATAATAVVRLLATYDAAMEANSLLGTPIAWNTDRDALVKVIASQATVGQAELGHVRQRIEAIAAERQPQQLSSDVLETLNSYGLGPIEGGYPRLVRREVRDASRLLYDPWEEFEDVLFRGRYSSDRFGGRAAELEALDAFVEAGDGGYFYITGPAGMGKTALIAEWLRNLRARGERPAFHFLTKTPAKFFERPYTELSCLQSLCIQLLGLHDLGGKLPPEADQLRRLYSQLLALPAPPDQRVVVVLDGLDEALRDWTPNAGMFPGPLGERVHVVFSARPIANKDWLPDLRLRLAPSRVWVLGQLDRAEVRDVLRRSGVAQTVGSDIDDLTDTVATTTKGDPDYVADVLELMKERSVDLGAIKALPQRHSDYLRQWWQAAVDDLHEYGRAFDDLMGTLAVLREPMKADDLVQVTDEDELRKKNIDVLLKRASRYTEGNAHKGYHLSRTRILELVHERLDDQMPVYRARVVAFCRRWNAPTMSASARRYGVRNGIIHLLEQNDLESAVALLDANFVAAKWRDDGSYISLLTDLDALLDWALAHPENRGAICRAPAFAIMRESARDLMRSLPTPLYAAWIRLEGFTRIRELLEALPSYRGEARQPLLAIAGEALQLLPADDGKTKVEKNASAHPEQSARDKERTLAPFLATSEEVFQMLPAGLHAGASAAVSDQERWSGLRRWAGALLGRVIGLMPLVRTAVWKLEAWSELCRLLANYRLEPDQLQGLLEQADAFLRQLGERDANLKAACLAHLARAVHPWDRDTSARFLESAERIANELPIGDRAMVLAIAFPVYRALDSDRAARLASETASVLQTETATSLSGHPLVDLLRAWALGPDPLPVAAMGRALAQRYIANPQDAFWVVPPGLLSRLGLGELAWQLLEVEAANHTEEVLAKRLSNFLLEADDQREAVRSRIISLYNDHVANDAVALALMQADYVTEALAVIRRLPADQLTTAIPECLDVVLSRFSGGQRDAAVGALLSYLERTPPSEKSAEAAARSALLLARAGLPQARAVYSIAIGRSLLNFPEGDTDAIRYLATLALVTAGEHEKSLEIARGCTWLSHRAEALVAVLDQLPLGSDDHHNVAEEIRDQLRASPFDTFLEDAAELVGEAAEKLASSAPEEATDFARTIEDVSPSNLRCLSTAAKIRGLLEPEFAPERARVLVAQMMTASMPDIWAVGTVVKQLARQNIAAARDVVDLFVETAKSFDDNRGIGAVIAVVAEVDPARAAGILQESLRVLAPTQGPHQPRGRLAAAAEHFRRMLSELTRDKWPWVAPFRVLLRGFVSAAPTMSEQVLTKGLSGAWTWLLTVLPTSDEVEVAVAEYFEVIAGLPVADLQVTQHLVELVPGALRPRLKEEQFSGLCMRISITLAANGHVGAARWLSSHIADDEDRQRGAFQIDLYEFFHSLHDRSLIEGALFQKAEQKALAALTLKLIREGHIDDTLSGLIDYLKQGHVRYLLMNRAFYFIPAVLSRWGTVGAALVVSGLQECDDLLVNAARQIKAAAASG